MLHIQETFKEKFRNFALWFDKITEPNTDYIQEKYKQEIAHNQNRAVLTLQFILIPAFLFKMTRINEDIGLNGIGLISNILAVISFLVCSHFRLHPQIFKMIFNLLILIFGTIHVKLGDQGIFGAWMATPIYPTLAYLITGHFWHFLFHIACQALFVNTFYQSYTKTSLAFMGPDEVTQALTYYSNQNILYSMLFVGLLHYNLQKAFYNAVITERKKDDFEKQKNFLLSFSHELRNLINSLMGNVKLAILEHPTRKIQELLVNAEMCSELLLHLVNNILDTGKAEINDLEITPVPTRIYDTMERIWCVCSELIKRKSLFGKMRIQKDIPHILSLDHYRITQIFLNLVGNATKFTDTGCIDVSVEWLKGQEAVNAKCYEPLPFNDTNDQDEGLFEKDHAFSILDRSFTFLNFTRKKLDRTQLPEEEININKKGVLKITVKDTGCGIPENDIPLLFQRFTQGTSDPSKKKLGTGLGLFITKELCQRMNGDIRVFSKKGKGSAFIFCIPTDSLPDEHAFSFDVETEQSISQNRQKLRAMVVDDEPFSQHILRDFLGKLDVDVVKIAKNGLMAFQNFEELVSRKEHVNVVTMDLNMPDMDGKAAAQKIREYEAAKNLKPCLLIIVSGNCSESEIKECLDKNGRIKADAFVKKPVSIDELNRIILCHYATIYNSQRSTHSID